MNKYEKIDKEIDRLLICQWAYGWNTNKLFSEINKVINFYCWEDYVDFAEFKDRDNIQKFSLSMIKELESNEPKMQLNKEKKHRGYANKYIKRKLR